MKKKFLRIGAGVMVAAIGAGALFMFAGCTSNHPEVRITYEFDGETYDVDYTLSRLDAPKTVQHFIELADAHFYDGLCIHDYQDGIAMFTGGYTLENGELEEINYLERVKELEEEGYKFTQSVWADEDRTIPLYSVYGEQSGKVNNQYGREYSHRRGALVMYYTEKKNTKNRQPNVWVERAKADDKGNKYQDEQYDKDSATSLFYTWLSSSSSSGSLDGNNYCVFGMAKDYTTQMTGEKGLLTAIQTYLDGLAEDESFTTSSPENLFLNRYDYFEEIANGGLLADFETPILKPIIIKSVKVTKY